MVVRQRTDHGDAGVLAERQHAVIFQKDLAVAGNLAGEGLVLSGIDFLIGTFRIQVADLSTIST